MMMLQAVVSSSRYTLRSLNISSSRLLQEARSSSLPSQWQWQMKKTIMNHTNLLSSYHGIRSLNISSSRLLQEARSSSLRSQWQWQMKKTIMNHTNLLSSYHGTNHHYHHPIMNYSTRGGGWPTEDEGEIKCHTKRYGLYKVSIYQEPGTQGYHFKTTLSPVGRVISVVVGLMVAWPLLVALVLAALAVATPFLVILVPAALIISIGFLSFMLAALAMATPTPFLVILVPAALIIIIGFLSFVVPMGLIAVIHGLSPNTYTGSTTECINQNMQRGGCRIQSSSGTENLEFGQTKKIHEQGCDPGSSCSFFL